MQKCQFRDKLLGILINIIYCNRNYGNKKQKEWGGVPYLSLESYGIIVKSSYGERKQELYMIYLYENKPSADQWLKEAKEQENAGQCGMYLLHNGTVRETAKAKVRQGAEDTLPVTGMVFSFEKDKVEKAIGETLQMEGIFCVKVWLASGRLEPGDDIMMVLIGGDIRPHVIDALQSLVGTIKNECVREEESFE